MNYKISTMKKYAILISLFVFVQMAFTSCQKESKLKPNILWIVLEDTAPLMGCYGTDIISTPNIDKLAKEGLTFTNAIMPAPVCSASRSSMITGVMSTTFGGHNHHSARTKESAIYLPEYMKTIPELFKDAGYFTFNNGKDDYNFTYNRSDLYTQKHKAHPLYGKGGLRIPIDSLSNKTPFFGQIQLYGGKEIFSSKFKSRVKTPVDRSLIKLPPYLPNNPVIIEEYANHLDAIQITDEILGNIIGDLKENGLLENTIVFFFADHGMRLTRHKQFLYEGGIKVPLIIADFTKSKITKSGETFDGLISGIDLGPSSLALAGIEIPEYIEGKDLLTQNDAGREFVISTRDRCDFTIDRIRSVRSKDFKYIKNFMLDRSYTQPTYMDVDGIAFVKTMNELNRDNKLDSIQKIFFAKDRISEELYDLKNDPYEIHNLALDSKYASELKKHADILENWIKETDDKGQYPENEEGLKLMLGIWGDNATNPEYNALKIKYPDLAGSQFWLKSEHWGDIEN